MPQRPDFLYPGGSPLMHPTLQLKQSEMYGFFVKGDPAKLQATVDQALTGTWNEIVGVSRDNQKVIVRASSDAQPATYYFADIGAEKMRRLGQEHPQLEKAKLATMSAVQIPGAACLF